MELSVKKTYTFDSPLLFSFGTVEIEDEYLVSVHAGGHILLKSTSSSLAASKMAMITGYRTVVRFLEVGPVHCVIKRPCFISKKIEFVQFCLKIDINNNL